MGEYLAHTEQMQRVAWKKGTHLEAQRRAAPGMPGHSGAAQQAAQARRLGLMHCAGPLGEFTSAPGTGPPTMTGPGEPLRKLRSPTLQSHTEGSELVDTCHLGSGQTNFRLVVRPRCSPLPQSRRRSGLWEGGQAPLVRPVMASGRGRLTTDTVRTALPSLEAPRRCSGS